MKTLLNRLMIAVFSSLPLLALAHPGHGVVEGWAHWFTPDHVLPGLAVVAALAYLLGRKKDREE